MVPLDLASRPGKLLKPLGTAACTGVYSRTGCDFEHVYTQATRRRLLRAGEGYMQEVIELLGFSASEFRYSLTVLSFDVARC